MNDEIRFDPFFDYSQNKGEFQIDQEEGDLGGPPLYGIYRISS